MIMNMDDQHDDSDDYDDVVGLILFIQVKKRKKNHVKILLISFESKKNVYTYNLIVVE